MTGLIVIDLGQIAELLAFGVILSAICASTGFFFAACIAELIRLWQE